MKAEIKAEMDLQIDVLNKKIIELQNQNSKKSKQSINVSNNNNSNNNSNNTIQTINNDIKVIAFGKENMFDMIDDETTKKYLDKGYQSICNLIEYVHFNPNKPEFHNVFIPSISHPYADVFDGERWNKVDTNEIVNQLFDDKEDFLNTMYKELKHTLKRSTIDKYSRFMNNDDKNIIINIKKDIKNLLLNKNYIPKETKDYLKYNKNK